MRTLPLFYDYIYISVLPDKSLININLLHFKSPSNYFDLARGESTGEKLGKRKVNATIRLPKDNPTKTITIFLQTRAMGVRCISTTEKQTDPSDGNATSHVL